MAPRKLKALAFNCSLKNAYAREKSSTEVLLQQLLDELDDLGKKWEKAKQQAESRTPPRRTPAATGRAGTGAKKKSARTTPRSTSAKRPGRKKA